MNKQLLLVEILSNELKKQEFNFRNRGEKSSPLSFYSMLGRLTNSEGNILFFCNLINNTRKKPKSFPECIKIIDQMIKNHFDFIDKYRKIYSEDPEFEDYLKSHSRIIPRPDDIPDYKDFYMYSFFEMVKAKFSLENSETKNNKNDSKDEVSQLREEVKNLKSFMNMLLLQRKGGVE